jgi:hypothetical protein|tara:strand:+ start:404 stop:985 length:582 start_codon:yes stop_codon:yes gene_type:complete
MAITTGISVHCYNLEAVGGIRHLLIRAFDGTDVILYGNTTNTHEITSIKEGASPAEWFLFEFRNETPVLNCTAARENGSTSFECSVQFSVPNMTNAKLASFQQMLDQCMMVMAVGNNGKAYVIGASQKYSNAVATDRSQTFCSLTALEGTTGAAYNDDNNQVVTLSCKQYELPRMYDEANITYYNTGLMAQTT